MIVFILDAKLYFKAKKSPAFYSSKKQTKDEVKARKEQEGKMRKRIAYRCLVHLEAAGSSVVEVELLHQHSSSEVIEMVVKKAKLKASDNWRLFEAKDGGAEPVSNEALLFEVMLAWGNSADHKFIMKT